MSLWRRDRRSERERLGLTRLEPVSRQFGFERGRPIDRFYIERFLEAHAADVHGRVLEVYEDTYTTRYGGDRVTANDILHNGDDNPAATIVGDLVTGAGLEGREYDCFIMTQTLSLIWDVPAAIRTARSLLVRGGVLLGSVPGISQTSPEDRELYGDWWRFTHGSTQRLFAEAFGAENVEVASHGNVLAAAAFLYGFAVEELDVAELEHRDDHFDFLMTVRAVRR